MMNKLYAFLLFTVILFSNCPSPGVYESTEPYRFSGPVTGQSWTIMYYLAAENSLETQLVSDFLEICQGQAYVDDINIVVFIDRDDNSMDNNPDSDWTGTRVYHVTGDFESIKYSPLTIPVPRRVDKERFELALLPAITDSTNKQLIQDSYTLFVSEYYLNSLGEGSYSTIKTILQNSGYLLPLNGAEPVNINAATGETLFQYVSFVKDNFISDHYMLSFGSHSNGWFIDTTDDLTTGIGMQGINEDNDNGTNSSYMQIYDIRQSLQYNRQDLIFTDSCSMGDIESAYEFNSITDYICYSQVPIGGDGLDYVRFFERLGDLTSLTSENIITRIINQYKEDYDGSAFVDLSAVGIKTGANLTAFVAEFQALAENSSDLAISADNINSYVPNLAVGASDYKMIDLKVLLDYYGDAGLLDYMEGGSKSFIVNSYSDKSGLNGISIYKPLNNTIYNQDKDLYAWTRFAVDYPNGWTSLLAGLY